jgi:DNA-binding SARP family transcriptional activator
MSSSANKPGRSGPALAALAWTVVLALLWVLRPPLPHLDPTGPVSTTVLEESIEFIAWALLALIIMRHSHEALHVLTERPSRRRVAENERLQRILASPVATTGPPRTYKRYRRPMKLVGHRRPDDDNGSDRASNHPPPRSSPTDDRSAADHPTIRISLLGPFEIEGVDHASLRTTCQQLIAYLALRPRGTTRDQLIEAVWPDEDPHSARHRLYQNISEARKLLGHALISKRSHYMLDRHKVAIDVDQLDQVLAELDSIDDPKAQRPTLERAVLLFRGEPLAGWNQEWTEGEVGRLRSAHIELLERAGHARLATGDAHGALKAAQQGLTLDGYNEGLWRLAMQADGRLGQRDSVGRRYEQLRRLLEEQLGLEPESTTRALYYELLGQR